jgi:DNA-binding MarR family transcriptional regulator
MNLWGGGKVEETLERRTYAISLLDELYVEGESTFSELLVTVGPSRATLSTTLVELGSGGMVAKRRTGRRTFYSITDKGAHALTEVPPAELMLDDRITNLVRRRLTTLGDWNPSLFREEMWTRRLRGRIVTFINRLQSKGPQGLTNGMQQKRWTDASRRDGRHGRPDGGVREADSPRGTDRTRSGP